MSERMPCACRTLYVFAAIGLLAGCQEVEPPERAPEWTLTPMHTIGPDQVPFGRIADLELGGEGTLYVLDALSRSVHMFGPDGRHVGTFGGPGAGPGEFQQPARLLWRPGGELWVMDPGNARLTSFDATGDLLETHPLPDAGLVFPLAVGFASADHIHWVGLTSPDLTDMAAAWAQTRLDGASLSALETVDLGFVEWPTLFDVRSEDMVLVLPVPFSGEPQFEFDAAGRLWYANTASPRVHRWSRDEGIAATVEVDAPSSSVTTEDREQALASPNVDELREIGEGTLADFSGMIPDVKPPIAGFFFDDQEHVWVAHGSDLGEATRRREISIFDGGGSLVASSAAEVTAAPRPRIRDGVLATVVRDELGVESVRLYRVNR